MNIVRIENEQSAQYLKYKLLIFTRFRDWHFYGFDNDTKLYYA